MAGRSIAGGLWNAFNSTSTPLADAQADWKTFFDLWQRAGHIRTILASQRFADQNALLSEFLFSLRQLFPLDFCFGSLSINTDNSAEIGWPEPAVNRLPSNFSRRCLGAAASSSTPVVWNQASAEFGFRTTVVVPITPPAGRLVGFLMLGNSLRRNYSPAEFFVLQSLATDLGRTARDLASNNDHQKKFTAFCHQVKNSLQVIIGSAALLALKINGGGCEGQKRLGAIETAAEQILDEMNRLSTESERESAGFEPTAETLVGIAQTVDRTIAANRRVAAERSVTFEVIRGSQAPDDVTLDPAIFIGMLDTMVSQAALATRDEVVRITLRRRGEALEVAVRGLEHNRVAEKLQALFQSALARAYSVRDEIGVALMQVRKYLASVGGDVYLKSRAGETAEFVVALPIDRSAQLGRLVIEN